MNGDEERAAGARAAARALDAIDDEAIELTHKVSDAVQRLADHLDSKGQPRYVTASMIVNLVIAQLCNTEAP